MLTGALVEARGQTVGGGEPPVGRVPAPDAKRPRGRRSQARWIGPVDTTGEGPETRRDVSDRLGMDHHTVTWLVETGAWTATMGGPNGRHGCIEERGWDRRRTWLSIMDRPESRSPRSFEAFELIARQANWLSVPGDYVFPNETCDAALELLEREGLPGTYREFAALFRAGEHVLPDMFARAIIRRGRPARHLGPKMPGVSVAEFRAALVAVDGVEGTLLAEPDEVIEKLIDAKLRGAIVRIPDPLIRNMAGLWVAARRREVTRDHCVHKVFEAHVAAEVLAGVDKKDAIAIDGVLRSYVFGKNDGWHDSAARRHDVGSGWLTLSNLWAAHKATYRGTGKRLKAAMPAFPHLVTHLGRDLRTRGRRLQRASRHRRKGRSDAIADMRDETEAALEARSVQVELHHAEFERRRAEMRADPSVREIRYSFEEDVVPWDGVPDGSRQVVHYRAVRAREFFAGLLPGAHAWDRRSVRQYVEGRGRKAKADGEEVLLVFEAVRPVGRDDVAVVPSFIRLHHAGVLCSPGLLNARKQAERAALFREWRIPGVSTPATDLVVQAWGTRSVAATWGLRQDVVVVHIDEYRHMARFARVLGRLGLRTGGRSGEARQLAWQVSGFGFARVNGQVRIGYRAIPKNAGERRLFLLDDLTFISIADLAGLSRATWGWDLLPRVRIERLRKAGPIEGHLLFQTPAGPLGAKDLNLFYRLFMAGLPPTLLHDLRHVYANQAQQDGVPLEDISDLLSHETKDLAAYYAAATARQLARIQVDLGQAADDRLALLSGGQGRPPNSPGRMREPLVA
ncbi:site-specific integrase [Sphingomonas sp. ABOLG]|uniref:site-specific integrase n=1 Tax=Sphingomonas sp. ABOLG TaxID=1985880 RepID=UPI000F7DB3E0|nr:site-specific integrase [Sphingomonas sp. ABOLG]RSV17315.1 site-specific integrase [Sphingomonas sp. ABOLG]